MKLGELFIKLGFDTDQLKLENFEKGIKSTARNVLFLKAAFAGAIFGMDRFVNSTIQGVASLENINQQTGLSIDLLQKWQKAGQLSNLAVSADQISGSIVALQKNIANLQVGKGNIGAFQMLGLDAMGKNAFEILDQLRERIGNYSPDIASNLISDLGLDPAMISVLKLSREEFERLGRNDFLTEKGRNAILATGKAIRDLKIRFGALKDQIALQLSPVLFKLLNGFFQWIIINKNNIITSIKFITKWIGNFFEAIKNSAMVLGDFISNILGLSGGVKGLGVAFAVLLRILKPVWFRIGLIIGLLDDIKVWKAGGDAMFGSVYEWVGKVFEELEPLFNMLEKIRDMLGEKAIIGAISGAAVAGPKGAIVGAIGGGIIDLLTNFMGEAKQSFIDSGDIDARGRIINNSTANNKIDIYISGSDNPQETATTVKRELNKAMGSIGNSFDK